VGWDPNKGFDLENVDSKLKQFFSRAGVSEQELQDKETQDFIYEFIERHGGVDAALMEEDDASVTQIIAPQPGGFSRSTSGPTLPPRNSSISHPAPPSKVQASPGKFVLQRLK
jgi:Wiskott-Aldrich syndrome protein